MTATGVPKSIKNYQNQSRNIKNRVSKTKINDLTVCDFFFRKLLETVWVRQSVWDGLKARLASQAGERFGTVWARFILDGRALCTL